MPRCSWSGPAGLVSEYHDYEWGMPVRNTAAVFEHLLLSIFRWHMPLELILRKREGFRAAMAGFNPQVLATFGEVQVTELLQNPHIIRNEMKIRASIAAAKGWLKLEALHGKEGVVPWIYRFVNGQPYTDPLVFTDSKQLQTSASETLSAELKRLHFQLMGPANCQVFMLSAGLMNGHEPQCPQRIACQAWWHDPLNH